MGNWKNGDLILAVVILAATGTMAVGASIIGIPQPPCASIHGTTQVFTITADLNGYNGTRSQGGNGPFMTVKTCDTVVIYFTNRDVQAHGLSVDFYVVNGLDALGGDKVRVQFLAFKPGQFRVFCNTLCSVHNYMQHAGLTVGCLQSSVCL